MAEPPSPTHDADENRPESDLIAQAQNGNLDAFNVLVRRYQDVCYNLAYRLMGDETSAEDATQEAFIKAYQRLDGYRGGSFEGWLKRIVSNTCYDEMRRRQRRPIVYLEDMVAPDSDDEAPLPAETPTPEQVAQTHELQRAIARCIRSLTLDQRMVLVLSDVEGLRYDAIAEQLQIAQGTVKSRLSRARLAVRRCLQGVSELLPAQFRLAE